MKPLKRKLTASEYSDSKEHGANYRKFLWTRFKRRIKAIHLFK